MPSRVSGFLCPVIWRARLSFLSSGCDCVLPLRSMPHDKALSDASIPLRLASISVLEYGGYEAWCLEEPVLVSSVVDISLLCSYASREREWTQDGSKDDRR